MKKLMPDTFFKRTYLMIMAAVLLTHVAMSLCMYAIFGPWPGPRPFASAAGGMSPHMPPPLHVPILIFMFWEIVIMGVAAWYCSKVFAKPIQELGQAASRLAEDLNSPPIAEEGPIEARSAATTFNQMQQRIRSYIEERSRFLAAVSHDLRTPLTRIRLRVDNLSDENVKMRLYQDIAEMNAMLDATLDFFRGQAATEEWQVMDVQALVEAIVEDAIEIGQDVSFSGQVEPFMTKPAALRRCLGNLVENALRYGEKAHINLLERSDGIVIEIHDNGPGIPEEKIEAVFEPFVRLEASRNKALGGVGLGLSIARDAVQSCGGKIELRNATGGGLIASVFLPGRGNPI